MEIQKSLQTNIRNSSSPGFLINNDFKVGETELIVGNNSGLQKSSSEATKNGALNINNGNSRRTLTTSSPITNIPDNSTTMGGQHSAYMITSLDEEDNRERRKQINEEQIRGSGPAENYVGANEVNEDVFTRYYRKKVWFVILIRSCCIASVISVCLNTPQTFKRHSWLRYFTLIIDIITGLILSCEAVIKIRSKGFIRSPKAYIRSAGRIFEFIMVVCIVVSIILQILEITIKLDEKVSQYLIISFVRVPRPLLLLRVLKSVLNLSLPKTVSLRSLKQIWGVLLFTAYFITLFALMGIQMFGLMKYYCIKTNASTTETQYTDLLIPATRCNIYNNQSFQCPEGFTCKELEFAKFRQDRRYFDKILTGLLTVYESVSMEGWSFVMYDAMDTRHVLFAVIYFICLIFFIAWLVRNVFIAIITEAFADLRVQVSKLSQRTAQKDIEEYQVLRKLESDDTMYLIKEKETILSSKFKIAIFNLVHWKGFIYFIYLLVLVDAVMQGFFSHKSYTGYIQIVFTMLFNIEALLKIYGMGFRHYSKSLPCRFEAIICIGSTAFLAPVFLKQYGFAVFQVLRPFRLVLLWGALTSFLKRILGTGKKITGLLLFTISALVMASGITLQLFCGIGINNKDSEFDFGIFPTAMRAMFQVFMAEAWNEVMDNILFAGGRGFAFLVFPVFILFHLLAAIILVSVFVALILDNLELNEELKIVKQRRLGEEVADTQEKLPARIRVFDHLKARPKVINTESVDGNLPKIRQSFVSNYISSADDIEDDIPLIANITASSLRQKDKRTANADTNLQLSFVEHRPRDHSFLARFRKQSSVTALMQEAHMKRMSVYSNVSDSSSKRSSLSKSLRRGVSSRTVNTSSKRYRNVAEGSHNAHVTLGMRLTNASNVAKKDKSRQISREQSMRDIDVGLVRQKLEEAQRKKDMLIENLRENHPKFDESLFIFSTTNPIRKFIQKIVHARYDTFSRDERSGQLGAFSSERFKRYLGSQTYLGWVMLLFTQVSCLAMLAETPSKRTFDDPWLSGIEYAFVISSSIELALMIIADGLFFAPKAFIQDVGGVLHVFIYVVSLTYVCWQPTVIPPVSVAQVLLVLRALRPLRIITLAPPLRKVVWVLVSGYKDMFKVALLQLVLMFVFASYGVQALSGKLERCNDPSISIKSLCNGTFHITLASPRKILDLKGNQSRMLVPRVWRNPRNFDFDDMVSAFLALFEVLSLEGWTEVRDIIHKQVGWEGSLYPHFYVFFACLIGLTLFIGVIVSSFNENKGIALLTVEQKRWKDLKKKLELAQPLHLPARPLEGSLRAQLFEIFVGKMYNRFYAFVVLLNCGTLCFGQWAPNDILDLNDDKLVLSCVIISIICCAYFTIETVLKIYAFSFKGYMLSWRNRFDFVLMLAGDIFSVWTILSCHINATENSTCDNSRNLGVAVFILRFLSLSGKHNGLRMLMLTVLMSLTKSFYTISVLLMIMACYAFTGVILFGSVKPGISLNRQVNFKTSTRALLVLFRITTGEDWNKIMHDAMIAPPYCRVKKDADYWFSNCGNKWGALIYFHSYYLIVSYIFLNLFIAVVIENFSIFYSTDDDPIMSQQDIKHYQETWNLVDNEKSGSISPLQAKFVLRLLRGGLDIETHKQCHTLPFKRMCAELEKIRNGKNVTFHNLLFVLAYKKIDISKSLQLEERLVREELDYIILEEVATETIRMWVSKLLKKHKESKPKRTLERRLSGISGLSLPSIDSLQSEVDDISASVSSLHSGASAFSSTVLQLNPTGSFENTTVGLEGASGLRKRKVDTKKDYKTDFYTWWDDEIDDNKE